MIARLIKQNNLEPVYFIYKDFLEERIGSIASNAAYFPEMSLTSRELIELNIIIDKCQDEIVCSEPKKTIEI